MKTIKFRHIWLLFLSIIFSATLIQPLFYAHTIVELIFKILVYVLLFIAFHLIGVKIYENWKRVNKALKIVVIFIISAAVYFLIDFVLALFLVGGHTWPFCTSLDPPSYQQNIITKKCEYGMYTNCGKYKEEKWYYKEGCDLPEEEKQKIKYDSFVVPPHL